MEKIIKTLFVPHCSVCGSYGAGLCRKCLSKCEVVSLETCLVCDELSLSGLTHQTCTATAHVVNSLFCCFLYKDIVRNVIRVSKYNQKEFYALKKLSEHGAVYASKCGKTYSNHLVAPIPLSSQRSRERGFNQSKIIAKAVSKEFGLEYRSDLLIRSKTTIAQAKLSRQERAENLKDAFEVKDLNSIKTRKVLLVDDICTTGSTLMSAAKALLDAGALEVNCSTLSKKVI